MTCCQYVGETENKAIYSWVGSMSREWLALVEIRKENENFF